MTQRILIMGLPGAGKTTLAVELRDCLWELKQSVFWFNADTVREAYQDWDFSLEGRIRQSLRMDELASSVGTDFVICDFVCPLAVMRENFKPDYIVWVDTITQGRFEDTNKLFEPPEHFDIRVTEQDSKKWATIIAAQLVNKTLNDK